MATGFADVVTGVQATIAFYAQALDDGRVEDLVATFCDDGSCEIPGLGAHRGRDELRAAFARWVPNRPQRHLVVNVSVRRWDDNEAEAVSDIVFLVLGSQGWSVHLVGRYHDVLHRDGDHWKFHHRSAHFEGMP
jgi:3-phenylpropionate/cinnamic acid dioxygenase small subunit